MKFGESRLIGHLVLNDETLAFNRQEHCVDIFYYKTGANIRLLKEQITPLITELLEWASIPNPELKKK